MAQLAQDSTSTSTLSSDLVVVYDTLANSWIPQLINNDKRWLLMGGLALMSIIIGFLLTMYGSSQTSWEEMEEV
jgi:Na+/proline symporter